MPKTPHQYFEEVIGKGFDEDGSFGVQCVDGFIHFCRTQIGFRFSGPLCYGKPHEGFACRIWYNFESLGLQKYFDKVPANAMMDGDWAIWEYGSKECPVSHIAMFRADNGNNKGILLGQNQNGRKEYSQMAISYSGILGAFRPKIYHNTHKIGYRSHIGEVGWEDWKYDGQMSGTTGQSKRIEAIQIDYKGDVYAKAHIQDIGWKDFGKITKDTVIGTTGESKRLECLCLKGNFKYRVHIQDTGWTCWTNADGIATLGSVGQGLRIEAIEISEI